MIRLTLRSMAWGKEDGPQDRGGPGPISEDLRRRDGVGDGGSSADAGLLIPTAALSPLSTC